MFEIFQAFFSIVFKRLVFFIKSGEKSNIFTIVFANQMQLCTFRRNVIICKLLRPFA